MSSTPASPAPSQPTPPEPRHSGTATHPHRPAEMVRWLHPQHLLRTGLDSLISGLFSARADARIIEALGRPQEPYFDYSQEEEGAQAAAPFWFDYSADTGDGWDSTYAVASALAQPTLRLEEPGGRVHETQRGRLLVLGGDEVYPVASRDSYEQRLVQPYEAALRRSPAPHPHLYALPGNHDWYDGLAAFTRLFCARRWLAGWQTRQSRSYFALRLPRGWWLLGVDVQLESDIDFPQVDYFRAVEREMAPEDRVILCSAEPGALHAVAAPAPVRRHGYLQNNLQYLQERILKGRVRVFLAGDLHQYRRHVDREGAQHLIAGGGGAFLHPTHAPAAPVLADGSPQVACFPSVRESRRLMWRNLLLARYSPLFGLITGTLYLLLALFTRAETGHLTRLSDMALATAEACVQRPSALALAGATLLGLVGFGRFGYTRGGRIAGLLHGLAQLLAAACVAWGAEVLWARAPLLLAVGPTPVLAHFAQLALLSFFGGYLVGPLLMGLYLLVSVNGFGAHMNEAAISLALPDWKNFLRLRIDPDGTLTVFPVGLARVPRRWKETGAGPHASAFAPDDPRATPPALIEAPIAVPLDAPRAPAHDAAAPAPGGGAP